MRYALTGDHHPALVVFGKCLTGIEAPVNLYQESVADSSTYGLRMNSISRQVSHAQDDLCLGYREQAFYRHCASLGCTIGEGVRTSRVDGFRCEEPSATLNFSKSSGCILVAQQLPNRGFLHQSRAMHPN